jgi:hypothetical protein
MTDEPRRTDDHGADDLVPTIEELSGAPKRRRTELPGSSIGGVLVGFDYQVFRASKPPAELVEKAAPIRGIPGEGGTMLSIEFPDEVPLGGRPEPAVPPAATEPADPPSE